MIDVIIVGLFIVYSVVMGLKAKVQASRSLRDYFLAGGKVKGWQAGVSMAATQYAADTPLLATGLVATGGVYVLWRFWIYGFGYLLLAFVFAELWRRSRVLTDAELTEIRYSGSGVLALRVLKAVYYGTIVNCFFLAMVLIAAFRIAEVFLRWHEWLPQSIYQWPLGFVERLPYSLPASVTGLPADIAAANGLISILAICLFVLLYSAVGGLAAVVATDVMQFLFMTIGTVAYAFIVIQHAGGLSSLGTRLVELYGESRSRSMMALMPTGENALLPFLAVLGLQGLFWISSDGTGYLAQRSMACRSDGDARLAGVVFAWLQIFGRSLLWLVIGVGLLVIYPFRPEEVAATNFAAARELTFITGIKDLMPVGLRGIMITGLLAALASTVDTHLNWGASYWTNDLYKRLICRGWLRRDPQGKELVIVARLANGVILLLSFTLMLNLGSIQSTWFASLVFGAGIGGVLMLRWVWQRINLASELAAIIVSMLLAPLVLAFVEEEWRRLAIVVGATMSAAIGVTFVTPATSERRLHDFCRLVRPMGWWNPRFVSNGPRQLRRRLTCTMLMTATLFSILVGAVRLLVPVPWVSTSIGWSFLVAGIVLTPLWWKEARDLTRQKRRPCDETSDPRGAIYDHEHRGA